MAAPGSGGSRVSPGTLIIAAAASATAAIVTSRLWKDGTILSAAMTPVIVAIVSDLLHQPAQKVTQVRSTQRTEPLPKAGEVEVPRATPRRPHLKIAVATGLIGFAIAAAALTLPELIFGGA